MEREESKSTTLDGLGMELRDKFFALMKKPIALLEKTLSKLSGFDFARVDALNECGFKVAFLCCLTAVVESDPELAKDILIENELSVEGGRIDILLYFKSVNAAVIIELKYQRCGYIHGVNHRSAKSLKQAAATIAQMDLAGLRALSFKRVQEDKGFISVLEVVDNALQQAERYAQAFLYGGKPYYVTEESLGNGTATHKVTNFYCVSLIGVVNRVVLSDFSKPPEVTQPIFNQLTETEKDLEEEEEPLADKPPNKWISQKKSKSNP